MLMFIDMLISLTASILIQLCTMSISC